MTVIQNLFHDFDPTVEGGVKFRYGLDVSATLCVKFDDSYETTTAFVCLNDTSDWPLTRQHIVFLKKYYSRHQKCSCFVTVELYKTNH